MALLKVGGGISRRFRYRDADHAALPGIERGADFIENIPGDVFRRRILPDRVENKVQVRMVKFLDYVGQGVFKGPEIDPDAQFVELAAMNEHLHPPVVTMHVFAGSVIIDKMMSRGEIGFG